MLNANPPGLLMLHSRIAIVITKTTILTITKFSYEKQPKCCHSHAMGPSSASLAKPWPPIEPDALSSVERSMPPPNPAPQHRRNTRNEVLEQGQCNFDEEALDCTSTIQPLWCA